MDLEIADLMAELDASIYILDCLPNMNSKIISERVEPFVKKLRKERPETPILLVEDRSFANTFLQPQRESHHMASRAALKTGFDNLVKSGVEKLYYLEGSGLVDNEGTVDASHPSDLGFVQQADVFEVILNNITIESSGNRSD